MNSSTNRRYTYFSGVFLALLLSVVTTTSAVFPGLTFAQDAAEAAAPGSNGSPLAPDGSDVPSSRSTQPEVNDTAPAPLNATLLAEPIYGAAPLAVDFFVSRANPQSSLVYQWNFRHGSVSSLPSGAYLPHVYQRPGTYLCSLALMNPQGVSTTVLTTVMVLTPKR
jgi:PKD repeat protein